jgi:NhaA family Na+:H+ antiporter
VSYLIVPIFALANAGIALSGDLLRDSASSPITLGVATGLVIGKPLGIMFACFVTVKLGIAQLPANAGYSHLLGAGLIAGIGFTVSLFIAGLAYTTPEFVEEAKLGILAASTIAGLAGFVYLWFAPNEPAPEPGPGLTPAANAHPGTPGT